MGTETPLAQPKGQTIYVHDGCHTFSLGLGLGYSLFYPKDVNRVMDEWQDGQTEDTVWGHLPLFTATIPHLFVGYAPDRHLLFRITGEFGWAYKLAISRDNNKRFFHYTRYSVGGTINGVFPFKNKHYEFLFGGGVYSHWLHFEDTIRVTPGYRVELGIRFNESRTTPEIFAALDYIRTNAGSLELDYTGGTIGFKVYFGVFSKKLRLYR